MMKNRSFWIGMLLAMTVTSQGCKDGCHTCSGATATQNVCEDDFTETSDYQNYINAYEAAGGVCEE